MKILIITLICIFFYAYFIEPNWIQVRAVELKLPHLAAEFDSYKIVQLSDIHVDKKMKKQRLTRLFQLVNQQKPDLIALTGDYATKGYEKFIPNLVTLSQLEPKDKTVAVLGNHDYSSHTHTQATKHILQQTNILNLANTVYSLQRGNAMLHIAGVDDVWARKDRLDLVLKQLPEAGAAILLAHEPDFADISAATGRFDLQLSGHSHGGQIRLPFFKPPILPPLGSKYYKGLYQVREMIQYTNRGIGISHIPLRFNSRPEITVFTLVADSDSGMRG
ncbi:MAG: metallophosphoesterase [Calothrix sp. MO_167.B12]|nr:metallophosphoesterase [Calothrix sp. MO_167.B12]